MNTFKNVASPVPLRISPRLHLEFARLVLLALIGGLLVATAHAQPYHKYIMRGQIVGATDARVVICIGSQDGAAIGQVLDVYKIEYEELTEDWGDSYSLRREHSGQITIESIIDEHFARAKIISGEAEVHDVVELQVKE